MGFSYIQTLYAIYSELDVHSIDKLCKIDIDFGKFIEQIEKLMTGKGEHSFYRFTENGFDEFSNIILQTTPTFNFTVKTNIF
jgi:hypothetical protein